MSDWPPDPAWVEEAYAGGEITEAQHRALRRPVSDTGPWPDNAVEKRHEALADRLEHLRLELEGQGWEVGIRWKSVVGLDTCTITIIQSAHTKGAALGGRSFDPMDTR